MTKPNSETPTVVFVFGLTIFLVFVTLISVCAWGALSSPDPLSHEPPATTLPTALLFLLSGLLIVFLLHIFRAIGLATAEGNPNHPIRFPWGISSCLATLCALVCLFTFQPSQHEAPLESIAVIAVESQSPGFEFNISSHDFRMRLSAGRDFRNAEELQLTGISPYNYLRERVQITQNAAGSYKVALRSEGGEAGAAMLRVLAKALQSDFRLQFQQAQGKMIQAALDARSVQAIKVKELSERMVELEPKLALTNTLTSPQSSSKALTQYTRTSSTAESALDWNLRLTQLELANAIEVYSEIDKEANRLEMLPNSIEQSLSFEEADTSWNANRYPPVMYGAAVFAFIFPLVFCFWCLARLSQRQHFQPHI